MRIYVVVGADMDGGFVDNDSFFIEKEAAEELRNKLEEKYEDMTFSISEVNIPYYERKSVLQAIISGLTNWNIPGDYDDDLFGEILGYINDLDHREDKEDE